MFDLVRYREGAVKVRVSGGWIERFVNRCLAAGFSLWQIETDGQDTLLWMRLADFGRVRPIARESRVRVRVIARRGCPFLVRRWFRRKGLIIGPLLFGILMYIFTLFVWQVEVIGNHAVESETILTLAEEQGIHVGAFCSAIEPREAEQAILARCGQLVWCGVRREGTRIVLEVVEKTPHRAESEHIGDVVARTDGVLTELIVLAGTAMKQAGDTVKEGEVLIAGIEPRYGELGEDIDAEAPRTVGAKGIVRARIWYEGYGEASRETIKGRRTGETVYGLSLQLGERSFAWQSEDITRLSLYETEKKLVKWRNQIFPVEVIIHIYHECEPITEAISAEEAAALAGERAWHSVAQQIPKDAEVIEKRADVVSQDEDRVVRVRALVETCEEIGVLQAQTEAGSEE
ncbi:MAG: sporulation protein YqfD [Selenomonadales bacterium]|nr:sporulation protein YqfD [Selenomonadales bacterium]